MTEVKKIMKLMPRTNSEVLEMHTKLIQFLVEGGYQYMDEDQFIKVQVPPLKLVEGTQAVPTPIVTS